MFVCVFLNGQLKGKVTKIKSNQIEFIPLNVYLSRVLIMEIRTHFAVRNQARHKATSFRFEFINIYCPYTSPQDLIV